MKKLLVSLLFVSLFVACQKTEKPSENLKFIETIPGGCAISDSTKLKNFEFGPDTVYYSINEGELDIFVGFTAECCLNLTPENIIRNDTIFIDIKYNVGPVCNCICYYTYNFHFSGIIYPHYYIVNIFDYLIFTGLIEP